MNKEKVLVTILYIMYIVWAIYGIWLMIHTIHILYETFWDYKWSVVREVEAQQKKITPTPTPTVTPTPTPTQKKVDRRVLAIQRFYSKYNSPLKPYAKHMVNVADKYGIDYRLIPAISIVESSGGKYNFRPYNAWGLMTKRQFKNYLESIEFVGRLLGKSYRSGCKTVECISGWYCPPTHESWAKKVDYLMYKVK